MDERLEASTSSEKQQGRFVCIEEGPLTPAAPDLAIGGDFNCSKPETVTNGDGHTPDPPSGLCKPLATHRPRVQCLLKVTVTQTVVFSIGIQVT